MMKRVGALLRRPVWIVVAVIALVITTTLLLLVLPSILVPADPRITPYERLQAQGEWRSALVQFLGSAAILAGLYFAGRNLQLTVISARHERETQAKTLVLTERGQITDRFTRAVEQLASEKLEVRLGGIFALEHIARDSDEYYEAIIEILTTFLRDSASKDPSRDRYGRIPADRFTVARVCGRRPEKWWREGLKLDLQDVDLGRANLWNAHFERANLRDANLEEAYLDGAFLQGADLRDARLKGAHFEGAHLQGADLRGAHFQGSHLNHAHFDEADTTGADFRFTDLSKAEGLLDAQVESALTDGTTQRPTNTRG